MVRKVSMEHASAGASLLEAFERFSERTVALERAYEDLQRRAAEINLELERTNRLLEEKVRQLDIARNFMHSMINSIPAGVLVVDGACRIKMMNPTAAALWGVDPSVVEGKLLRDVVGEHAFLLEDTIRQRKAVSARREVVTADGFRRVLSTTVNPVVGSDGTFAGAVQVDQDITEMLEMERRMLHDQRLVELGKRIASIAHEVRKPLNGIKGFASLLGREAGEERIRRKVERIIDSVDGLNSMLEDLLDFARPGGVGAGKCDLARQIGMVVDLVRADGLPAGVNIDVQVPLEYRMVKADGTAVRQMLLNLVKNAVEAVGDDGNVYVRVGPAGEGRVRVEVEDDGPGIPAEAAQRIFEPFFTTKRGGSGLGLAVVSRLAARHGTEVKVENGPKGGAVFRFELPLCMEGEDD